MFLVDALLRGTHPRDRIFDRSYTSKAKHEVGAYRCGLRRGRYLSSKQNELGRATAGMAVDE